MHQTKLWCYLRCVTCSMIRNSFEYLQPELGQAPKLMCRQRHTVFYRSSV
jgi:hypothetical protein